MSTAPSSLLRFLFPFAGLCTMVRSCERDISSRGDTLLRQSWVSAVKRTPLWHTAFEHKGPEMKSHSWGSPRKLQREVVSALCISHPDVFSCEVVLCKQDFRTSCSITKLIKRTYAFYLYSVLHGESKRGSSLSSLS